MHTELHPDDLNSHFYPLYPQNNPGMMNANPHQSTYHRYDPAQYQQQLYASRWQEYMQSKPGTPQNQWKLAKWWFDLSLPPAPGTLAPLEVQEKYRRSQLASIMMGLVLLSVAVGAGFAVFFKSTIAMVILSVVILEATTALLLNKAGQLVLAGIIFIGMYSCGIVASFWLLPGGLGLSQVIGYDLLICGVLFSALFFPAWSVFVVAIMNCGFIFASFTYQTHAPELTDFIQAHGAYVAIERTLFLEIIVAVLTYLLVGSAQRALARANKAEEIARLQQILVIQERQAAEQKVQLESSIQQIVNTLVQYANGNTSARVPFSKENVLWNIAGTLNNLLGRVHRLRQENEALHEAFERTPHVDSGELMNQPDVHEKSVAVTRLGRKDTH